MVGSGVGLAPATVALMARRRDMDKWTPEALEQVRQMTEAGMTGREIAAATGRTTGAVHNVRVRHGFRAPINGRQPAATMVRQVASYGPPDSPPVVEIFAPQVTAEESDDEFLRRYRARAAQSVQTARAQRFVTVKVVSDVPIGIITQADQHIDGTGTDLEFLEQTARYVAETPNLYTIDVGDLMNNNIVHRDRDIRAVADQVRFTDLYIGWHRGKWWGGVGGNHTDWTKQVAGVDVIGMLAKRHKFHYAPDELIWTVQIANPHNPDEITAEWVIATRHQYRRHSNMNPQHACLRWMEENAPNLPRLPDAVVLAHNHTAHVGVVNYKHHDVWAVRPGSAQVDSSYARQKGFQEYRPTAPVIICPPTNDERMQCFSDASAGIQHMRGWRDVAA